jgi:hypothetical protein
MSVPDRVARNHFNRGALATRPRIPGISYANFPPLECTGTHSQAVVINHELLTQIDISRVKRDIWKQRLGRGTPTFPGCVPNRCQLSQKRAETGDDNAEARHGQPVPNPSEKRPLGGEVCFWDGRPRRVDGGEAVDRVRRHQASLGLTDESSVRIGVVSASRGGIRPRGAAGWWRAVRGRSGRWAVGRRQESSVLVALCGSGGFGPMRPTSLQRRDCCWHFARA